MVCCRAAEQRGQHERLGDQRLGRPPGGPPQQEAPLRGRAQGAARPETLALSPTQPQLWSLSWNHDSNSAYISAHSLAFALIPGLDSRSLAELCYQPA